MTKSRPVYLLCAYCDRKFRTTPKRNKKFCSLECYLKSHVRNTRLMCKQCKKQFMAYPCQINRRLYCNVACRIKAQTGKPRKNGTLQCKKNCLECGKEFTTWICLKDRKKYCGKKCSGVAQARLMVKAHQKQWVEDKEYRAKRSAQLSELRLHTIFPKKDTSIEILLQEELRRHKISYEKHISLPGQPDIFIEPNICIFADGCYWHGCPQCGYVELRPNKDRTITSKLETMGYKVLRFWEHTIKTSPTHCVQQIITSIS